MESKIGATERLRREGRWEEASEYRDKVRSQLRADGKSKTEAAEVAWVAMIEKFPPQTYAQDQDDPDIETLVARTEGDKPDLGRDILWVYENVENKQVRATDAPSPGAWSMLKWVRDSPNRFFEQLLPKALALQEKEESQSADSQDKQPMPEDHVQVRMRNMLADLQLQWERDAVANVSETVKRDVKSRISDWERRFQLDLPHDARESWRNQMVELADKLISVAIKNPEAFETDQLDPVPAHAVRG